VLEALIVLARENRVPACGIEFEINGGNRHYATPAYLEKISGLLAELKQLEVDSIRVVENGSYARDRLAERMKAVDWVIVPSTWWEVFGLVASEAWMFGRPVVAAAIGALGERITDGVNGFTFPARDAKGLADVIARLAGDERKWLAAASGITQPWSEFQMLDAHMSVWSQARDRIRHGFSPSEASLERAASPKIGSPRKTRGSIAAV
jgi:glycosyltransferase involved in cell wall biosynthesis